MRIVRDIFISGEALTIGQLVFQTSLDAHGTLEKQKVEEALTRAAVAFREALQ